MTVAIGYHILHIISQVPTSGTQLPKPRNFLYSHKYTKWSFFYWILNFKHFLFSTFFFLSLSEKKNKLSFRKEKSFKENSMKHERPGYFPYKEPLVVSNFLLCFPLQYSFGISGSAQKQLCPKWEKEEQPEQRKTGFSNGAASSQLQAAFCLGSVRYTTGVLLLCNQRTVACYLLFGFYLLKSLSAFINLLWNTRSVYPAVNLIF